MKIEITRDVEFIAQQVSIKCYLAIFTDVVIFGEFEGGFSELLTYQRCANIDIKNMFFTVQPIITFAVVKKNNIFWIIALCYSYIFHDLKRWPYALEMKKQI